MPDYDFDFEAEVRYEPNKIVLLNSGWFVRCAVTGKPIYVEDLRYWNVERQEAYVNASAAWKRECEVRNAAKNTPD